jgi:hypothetical protein
MHLETKSKRRCDICEKVYEFDHDSFPRGWDRVQLSFDRLRSSKKFDICDVCVKEKKAHRDNYWSYSEDEIGIFYKLLKFTGFKK